MVVVRHTNSVIRFKAAYCTIWEKVRCDELFGEMDVTADSFVDLARGIIAAASNARSK
jgi:2-haloacid dehalogenase